MKKTKRYLVHSGLLLIFLVLLAGLWIQKMDLEKSHTTGLEALESKDHPRVVIDWGLLEPWEKKLYQDTQFKIETQILKLARESSQKKTETTGKDFFKFAPGDMALEQVRQSLSEFPQLEEIEVRRLFLVHTSLRLRLKKIVSVWISRRGDIHPVAASGELLPKIASRPLGVDPFLPISQIPMDNLNFHETESRQSFISSLALPLLKGSAFYYKHELRKSAVHLLAQLPQNGSALSVSQIESLEYDEKDGFALNLKVSQVKVQMGSDRIKVKTARVEQVLNYLMSRQMEARVIDANLSKKVLVRLRKDP